MYKEVAVALPDASEARPPAERLDPEAAFAAASLSRDPPERLLSRTLQSLAWFADAALTVAYTVDGRGSVETPMMHCTPGRDRRDAAADVGGIERYARSVHGQHVREYGYGAPVVLYLWRDGRVAAGVRLLREWHAAPFDAATVRLIRHLQTLLQHSYRLAAAPQAAVVDAGGTDAGLTVREAEIARLVAGGASNAVIAGSLTISEATVKAHLTRIYAKLGVRSRTQLAVVLGDGG